MDGQLSPIYNALLHYGAGA